MTPQGSPSLRPPGRNLLPLEIPINPPGVTSPSAAPKQLPAPSDPPYHFCSYLARSCLLRRALLCSTCRRRNFIFLLYPSLLPAHRSHQLSGSSPVFSGIEFHRHQVSRLLVRVQPVPAASHEDALWVSSFRSKWIANACPLPLPTPLPGSWCVVHLSTLTLFYTHHHSLSRPHRRRPPCHQACSLNSRPCLLALRFVLLTVTCSQVLHSTPPQKKFNESSPYCLPSYTRLSSHSIPLIDACNILSLVYVFLHHADPPSTPFW